MAFDMGMSMMLKSMGIDTEQIQQAINQTVTAVQNISARMDSIEKRLSEIENNLATLNLAFISAQKERQDGNSIRSIDGNSASGNGSGNRTS